MASYAPADKLLIRPKSLYLISYGLKKEKKPDHKFTPPLGNERSFWMLTSSTQVVGLSEA